MKHVCTSWTTKIRVKWQQKQQRKQQNIFRSRLPEMKNQFSIHIKSMCVLMHICKLTLDNEVTQPAGIRQSKNLVSPQYYWMTIKRSATSSSPIRTFKTSRMVLNRIWFRHIIHLICMSGILQTLGFWVMTTTKSFRHYNFFKHTSHSTFNCVCYSARRHG